MIAFVKSIRDFSTIAAAQVVSWDLPLATAGDDTGSVVLLGESAADREGNWLVIDRRIYLISQTAYSKGMTTLTLQMPLNAFDRGIYYPGAGASIEEFIAAALTSAYKTVGDSYFAMPYLNINADSTTAFTPPQLSDGMYVMSDYIKSVQPSTYTAEGAVDVPGVICDFSCTDTTLNIRLHNADPVTRKVIFDTSLFQLKSRACNRDIISKVSVVVADTGTTIDFYLTPWGTAGTQPPAERVVGKWVSVAYSDKEPAIDTARKVFRQNQDTHKIEFYSRLQFNLLDPIMMRMGDAVEIYRITCIRASSTDDRYLYTCGDLPTTLTDKIRQISKHTTALSNGLGGGIAPNQEVLDGITAERVSAWDTAAAGDIAESGVSGGWTYIKLKSGIAMCWGRYIGNVNAAANNWSGYYYSGAIEVDFPFAFKTLEAVNFDGGSNDFLNVARNFASTLTQARFLIIGHSADATNVGIDVSISAKGRWK